MIVYNSTQLNNKQPYANYLGSATRIQFYHSALFKTISIYNSIHKEKLLPKFGWSCKFLYTCCVVNNHYRSGSFSWAWNHLRHPPWWDTRGNKKSPTSELIPPSLECPIGGVGVSQMISPPFHVVIFCPITFTRGEKNQLSEPFF